MKRWITAVQDELGIDLDADVAGLLDMTKVVAHEVARPAAPVTAFLVGYAAARAGGGPAAVAEANRTVVELAERWAAREHDGEHNAERSTEHARADGPADDRGDA